MTKPTATSPQFYEGA